MDPHIVITHYSNIKKIQQDHYKEVFEELPQYLPNTWGLVLPVVSGKRKHFWFWSEKPDRGKTTFLAGLEKFGVYYFNYQEKYQEINKGHQVVAMDEYSKAHLTYMSLN